jgi:hypothetical protein
MEKGLVGIEYWMKLHAEVAGCMCAEAIFANTFREWLCGHPVGERFGDFEWDRFDKRDPYVFVCKHEQGTVVFLSWRLRKLTRTK